jgi:hypothetical protein
VGNGSGAENRQGSVSHAASDRRPLGPLALVAVVALVLWAAIEVLSGFVLVVWPSHFGFSMEPDGKVVIVEPNSPASEAGIRVGDRIAVERFSAGDRQLIQFYKVPGTPLAVVVERAGQTRNVRLESRVVAARTSDWVTLIAGAAVALVFVGIATALVLLRPNRVTWGFFLFACGYSVVQLGSLQLLLRPPWFEVHAALLGVALLLTIWGGAVFIARFPDGSATGWSALYERAVLVVMPFVAAVFASTIVSGGTLRVTLLRVYDAALLALLVAAVVLIVVRSRVEGDVAARARGRWVLVGSAVGIGALTIDFALHLTAIPGFPNSPLDIVLGLVVVVIPISVAYAVLRHHVIDVRFAVNRALVYGTITSLFVLAFSAIEWTIGQKLADERVAGYIEIAVALAIGFWFNLLHRRVERFFDRIFFRHQHNAEQHLARVATAIPHATSMEAVDRFMLNEPARAYRLTSAALFRRTEGGDFERVAAIGWPPDAPTSVPQSDPLVAYLSAERAPLDLDDVGWAPSQPSGTDRPIVGVPISVRHRLMAFALYGATEAGETLDPDQRRMLQHLATAAAAAYDHLEAEALRREIAKLRGRLGATPQRAPS